jgi:hypothetical protein
MRIVQQANLDCKSGYHIGKSLARCWVLLGSCSLAKYFTERHEVSGHDFGRAENARKMPGFSP